MPINETVKYIVDGAVKVAPYAIPSAIWLLLLGLLYQSKEKSQNRVRDLEIDIEKQKIRNEKVNEIEARYIDEKDRSKNLASKLDEHEKWISIKENSDQAFPSIFKHRTTLIYYCLPCSENTGKATVMNESKDDIRCSNKECRVMAWKSSREIDYDPPDFSNPYTV
ncbi:MAG: hypothetical protein IIC67_01065 [Thaumarchaeota archaeon]|nr:hypothetical protein [Nitrososphaerota archaeon]